MNKLSFFRRNLIIFGLPFGLLGFLIYLMSLPLSQGSQPLSLAFSLDLLITVPFIYFLLIRKTSIPKTTVFPIAVVGLFVGSVFLGKDDQIYLELFKTWVLPALEVTMLIFAVIKVRKTVKKFRALSGTSPDLYTTLKAVVSELAPKRLVAPLATEVAVIYFGFISWKKHVIRENEFSYHKRSATASLMGAFILIIGAETIAFHFLIAHWNEGLAWLLTALSIYTAIQCYGFTRSLSKRPIFFDSGKLYLRFGIMNEAEISLSDIESIALSRKALENAPLMRKLSPLGDFDGHNVIIKLKNENELIGAYGFRKKFHTLALHLDTPAEFKLSIDKAIEKLYLSSM